MHVEDVMTQPVISVAEDACFREIARTLFTHKVSAVPVVDLDRRVVGIVSEADLLHKEESRELLADERSPQSSYATGKGPVARDVMVTPVITVPASAGVTAAGRLMYEHKVKRLPVVDEAGRLIGIVSRHDLLKAFVRSDRDIEDEVRVNVLCRSLWMDTSLVHVSVADGVVTLRGRMGLRHDTEIAVWMVRQVNGVIDVINELEWDLESIHTGESC